MTTTPVPGPPLKWAGGKRWLVPRLAAFWNGRTSRFVEPFCGGLAISLALRPAETLLNDSNPHLVNFYRWLRKGLDAVSIPMLNASDTYYENRQRFNQLLSEGKEDSAEAAALFYYLNRTGYNGLCRFNQRGEFNVPFGRYQSISYVRNFSDYEAVFKGWQFSVDDFEGLELRRTDFIYADPPYDVQFTQYSKDGFSWDDQVRAAEWLSKHKGPVVMSNQATARILTLYKKLGYTIETLKGRRLISCTGNRTPALEVLATRNL